MHESAGGWLRIPSFGLAALAALAALASVLAVLLLAPAAQADPDPGPQLTDLSGSISTTTAGHTVTLHPGSYSADSGGPVTTADSWYRCTSPTPGQPPTPVGPNVPAGCTPVINPSNTYLVTAADEGQYITVFETDAAAVVAATQTDQDASNSLAVVPANKAAPSIVGGTTSGSMLSAEPGLWVGGSSYSYSWSSCNPDFSICTPPSTAATYQLTPADVGGYISLTETASNSAGSATATSAAFGPITTPAGTVPPPDPPDAGTAVPTVSGTPQVGATLIATPVTMSNHPTYAYQWLRCPGQSCTAIPGATSPTYSPVAADLGDALAFLETGTNAGGSGRAQSAKSAVVTAPTETTLQITPSGVVAGQTATLVATVTSATGQAPPSGTISFEQAGAAIAGCASITTHPSGASATITCQATFAGSASTLSAVFTPSPGAQVTGSDSSAVGFVLGRAATATTMVLPAHVTLGKRLTLTAKVVPQAGTKGVSPTGNVVFLDGKQAIKGCAPTLTDGVAHCVVTYKALGTHSISANYLGDGNFSGSGTHVHPLGVLVAKPTGYVSSLMTWTFLFKPHYTRVSTLTVTGVQPGLTISVGCSGSGCPNRRYVDTVTRAACGNHGTCQNVNLAKRFSGRKLDVGATLTVRLTHRGWLGKYYSFVVRPGHKPKIDTACLAVGQTKPGAGCTPQ